MQAFQPVCHQGDIPSGKSRAFEIGGVPILLLNVNRVFYAVRNRCTHLDYPLEGGRLMGWDIMCRKHGACFDIRDGHATVGPAVTVLPVYPVRVVDGMVEVNLKA